MAEEEKEEIVVEEVQEEKEETKQETSSEKPEEQEQEQEQETQAEAPKGNEDELESYSKNVQCRIKKSTDKYRQQERDKLEADNNTQK